MLIKVWGKFRMGKLSKFVRALTLLSFFGSHSDVMSFNLPPLGNPSLDGAYVGILGGMNYNFDKLLYQDNLGKDEQKTNKYAAITGGFGGYLLEIGATRTLVGVETNALISTMLFKKPFGSGGLVYGDSKTERQSSVNVTGVVGKLFNVRTFLFLKAGVETINYKISLIYNTSPTTPAYFAGKTKTVMARMFGVTLGLGLDYVVFPGVAVGGEYNFLGFFRSKRLDVDTSAPNPPLLYFRPKEHRFMIRVSYRM